jgi:TPR repeat protein
MGYMFESGKGMAPNYAEAVKWYTMAAEKGDTRAQLALGYLLADGKAGTPNLVSAHMWTNLAAAQLSGAERKAAEQQRDYLASKLKPDELVKAQQLARDFKPKN